MGIIDKAKKAVKRIMGDEQQLQEDKQQTKLEKWKKKLNEALSQHDSFRAMAAVNDAQYNGTKEVLSSSGRQLYMSDRFNDDVATQATANARQVVNITFQLIESQIDISVPMPNVEAIEGDDDNERKKMIEGMLTYMAEGPDLERINSENERITKKNSMSVLKVMYNPSFKSHKFRGRVDTTNPHPINIIPQPNVYRVKDMDYLYHIENRTVDYICGMDGEEFRDQLEDASAEYGYLEELSNGTSVNSNNNMVSVVECWYKDKDRDVCYLKWANDVILKDEPKFYYPRDPQGKIMETEEVDVEQVDEETGQVSSQTVTVRRRIPKDFPFVIWYNIPREKKYYGKSDPEIISDQQEGIKKMLSIEEEKQVKGTSKIFVRKGMGIPSKLDNAVSKIIEVDDPIGDVRVVDLKTPDNALKDLYGIYLQAAKDSLGVTEASQGRADGTTLSGRALDILAQNTAGRISVKIFEKQIAFTELYRLYYDFLLAFIDDARPYRIAGKDNKPTFGYFDKSKLLKQDDAGEWYYPEFDIKISVDSGLPKDKRFILDAANQGMGKTMDPIEYWMVLESIGFPNSTAILEREQQKEAEAKEAANNPPAPPMPQEGTPMGGGPPMPQQPPAPPQLAPEIVQVIQQDPQLQQALQALPEEQLAAFFNAPADQQVQFLAQLKQQGGGMVRQMQ